MGGLFSTVPDLAKLMRFQMGYDPELRSATRHTRVIIPSAGRVGRRSAGWRQCGLQRRPK